MSLVARTRLISRRAAAVYLGVHPQTLWVWVRLGKIPAVRIRKRIKFDREQLDKWIAAQQQGGAMPKH